MNRGVREDGDTAGRQRLGKFQFAGCLLLQPSCYCIDHADLGAGCDRPAPVVRAYALLAAGVKGARSAGGGTTCQRGDCDQTGGARSPDPRRLRLTCSCDANTDHRHTLSASAGRRDLPREDAHALAAADTVEKSPLCRRVQPQAPAAYPIVSITESRTCAAYWFQASRCGRRWLQATWR